jgi:hypothetical protein
MVAGLVLIIVHLTKLTIDQTVHRPLSIDNRLCLLSLASLVACQGAGDRLPGGHLPEGYSDSYAMRDCAPWDGPAVTVFLTASPADSTSVPTPYLGLSTYRSPTEVEGRRFEWPAKEQVAGAYRCRAEGDCEASRLGYIRFDRSLPDGTLIGAFVAEFPRDTVEGGFRATWVARRMFCG